MPAITVSDVYVLWRNIEPAEVGVLLVLLNYTFFTGLNASAKPANLDDLLSFRI